jgi:hypothetical protein
MMTKKKTHTPDQIKEILEAGVKNVNYNGQGKKKRN